MTPTSIPARVAAGAAWLDANVPDWVDRIDLTELNLMYCDRCVLGQVFGTYWGSPLLHNEYVDSAAVPLGFQSFRANRGADDHTVDEEYAALGAEWRRVVSERRAAAVPS